MNIFWRFSDSDSGTLTASNSADGYPASNLQLNTLGSQWRSDSASATAELVLNLGSAKDIDSFALLGLNLTPGSDTVTLTYASDAAFTADTGAVSVTLTANNLFAYFSTISRQYWKVTITKALSTNEVQVGRMVLGERFETTFGLMPGYSIGPGRTLTRTTRTRGGQLYSNTGETLRRLRGRFPGLLDADLDELEELQETNSTGIPFIVSIDWANHPTRKSIYGTLDSVQPFTDVANGDWEFPLSMTEQK